MNDDGEGILRKSALNLIQGAERAVQGAAQMLILDVEELRYADGGHKFSERSCATCRMVSGIMGFEVGCNRFRLEKAKH